MKRFGIISLILVLAGAMCFCFTGCGDKNDNETGTEMTAEDVTVEEVVIELEANPTTGYNWIVDQSAENGVEAAMFDIVADYTQDEGTEGLDGAGGTEKFTLKAVASGTAYVKLSYVRGWDDDEPLATGTYKYKIDDNLGIIELGLIETTGSFEDMLTVKG